MNDSDYKDIISKSKSYIQNMKVDDELHYQSNMTSFYIKVGLAIIVLIVLSIISYFLYNSVDPLDNGAANKQFFSIILVVIGLVPIIVLIQLKPKRKNVNYDYLFYEEVKRLICNYLVEELNISYENIKYDLDTFISRNKRHLTIEEHYIYSQYVNRATGRVNTKKISQNLERFWLNKREVDFIYNKIHEKYKKLSIDTTKTNLSIEKIKLQNEMLKLQNESIAIDNQQKKVWTCAFCGNMNHADDMQCIKCGGQRVN